GRELDEQAARQPLARPLGNHVDDVQVRHAVRQEVSDGNPDCVAVLGEQRQLALEVLPAERKPRERALPGLLEERLQQAVDVLGVVRCCVANGQSREASAPAFRCARAEIEIIGLTPEALGNPEPSQTTTSGASQRRPSQSQAETSGEAPMRAVPIWWNE